MLVLIFHKWHNAMYCVYISHILSLPFWTITKKSHSTKHGQFCWTGTHYKWDWSNDFICCDFHRSLVHAFTSVENIHPKRNVTFPQFLRKVFLILPEPLIVFIFRLEIWQCCFLRYKRFLEKIHPSGFCRSFWPIACMWDFLKKLVRYCECGTQFTLIMFRQVRIL